MKKVFKLMMMALVAIVMSVGFAACSSDDDDNNNNQPSTPEQPKTYGFTNIHFAFSEDLLAVANITVTYTTEDGTTTKTETVTSTKFDKEITYTKNPSDAMFAFKFTLKDNFEEKDTYHIVVDPSGTRSNVVGHMVESSTDYKYTKDKLKAVLKTLEDLYNAYQ